MIDRRLDLRRARHARVLAGLCVLAALATPAGADALAPSAKTPDAKAAPTSTGAAAAATGAGGTAAPNATGSAPAPATSSAPAAATTGTSTPSTTPSTSVPATSTPATSTPASTPAPVTPGTAGARTRSRSHGSGKLSTPAIALAGLAGLLALACLAWALARLLAFEPHWVKSLRHALAEGGFRASATWAEFLDWARLGR
jgi:hypothetical protein